MSKTLLLVYHSRTGGTLQMVQALQAGAQGSGAALAVRLLRADEVGVEDLLAAQAYVFAAPENLASVSGVMKEFFDRCYYGVLGALEGRACALLVCAGSDGAGAVRQMQRIITGWRLNLVAAPLIVCTHAQTPQAIAAPKQIAPADGQRCYELGQALALGLDLGIF